MFIYEIINKTTGRRYIGQTIQKDPRMRWRAHRCSLRRGTHFNVELQRAWNKYEELDFEFNVIKTCNTLQELNNSEILLINDNVGGYNEKRGGDNEPLSESTKLKISLAKRGKKLGPFSKEHKQKISIANSNRIWKQESKDKLRDWNMNFGYFKGKKRPDHSKIMKGENNPSSKLTNSDIHYIRKSNDSQKNLACKFGVSSTTIHRIKTNKSWKNIV